MRTGPNRVIGAESKKSGYMEIAHALKTKKQIRAKVVDVKKGKK